MPVLWLLGGGWAGKAIGIAGKICRPEADEAMTAMLGAVTKDYH